MTLSALSHSAQLGTAISAAPEGVGARTSATKSAMVKSISWPTPTITGVSMAARARATTSSLNDQRSSKEPPPRVSIRRSHSCLASARRNVRAIWSAAPSPCTGVGYTRTGTAGKRRASTVKTSRTAAPLGDVRIPIRSGSCGRLRLRSASNNPSAASFFFSSSNRRRNSPSPASSRYSTTS